MTTAEQLLSVTDFQRLYEHEGAFELINGERKALMPPVMIHVMMIRALFRILDAYCAEHHWGEVLTEAPFVITYDQQWVKGSRVPDLMFFARERWQQYIAEHTDWALKPALIVPDMVIEVVSTHDLYTDIQAKVEHYLQDGVTLIWVIDPMRQKVIIYTGEQMQTLSKEDKLSGGDIFPDLTIDLGALFAQIDD